MKIAIITVCKIRNFPPIDAMLKVLLDLGHEILFITHSKDLDCQNYNSDRLKNLYIYEKDLSDIVLEKVRSEGILNKKRLAFWGNKAQKMVAVKKLPQTFRTQLEAVDVVWILHEDTILAGGKTLVNRIPQYLYTMYELPLKFEHNKQIYKYAAQKAAGLITPDFCRAHIMKAIYQTKQLPYIVPNKPYSHPRQRGLKIEDPKVSEVIENIEASGRKIIMYMGIISGERPLDKIINAVYSEHDKYEFVVIGEKTSYLEKLQKEYKNKFIYAGYIKPPEHLAVASHAHIAYVSYIANNGSINAVFCAPNKLFEFAGFGIPMICNDNPNLVFTVKTSGIGRIVYDFNQDNLLTAINDIEDNYEQLSDNAIQYYESVDLKEVYSAILKKAENKRI